MSKPSLATIPPADLERIYADLRRHAQTLLVAERPAHTLQATALVHEAMVKLLGEFGDRPLELPPESALADRRKVLFSMISLRMRQVLVEHARHRNALKGPGQWTRSPLHEAMAKIEHEGVDLIALDRALAELQRVDADAAAVFQHRWFGGLSMEHVASILEITPDEAQRRWTRARKVMRGIMRGKEEGT
ncbi:MAG: ECF-type sigma factor [Phycisphaerales bacterium]